MRLIKKKISKDKWSFLPGQNYKNSEGFSNYFTPIFECILSNIDRPMQKNVGYSLT